jgi:outer membrane protein assembly factor BamB
MRRTLLLASVLLLAISTAGCGSGTARNDGPKPPPDPSRIALAPHEDPINLQVRPISTPGAEAAGEVGNWSFWRGPEQNGVSREKELPKSFDIAKGENVIWKAPVGGRTTPIVQKGHVYFLSGYNKTGNTVNQQERLVCLDANTGKELWQKEYNVFLTDVVSDRLGWTFMVGDPETDTVFAHGSQGHLLCLDREGKEVWRRQMTEEFGRVSGYGGRITSPIIDGDLLILSMPNSSGGHQGFGGIRLVAFDKRTGNVVWWSETDSRVKDTYYSVPVVAVINGDRLIITGAGDGGVHAFRVRTGEKVWSYLFSAGAVNCSPVVDGTYVYIGHGEANLAGGVEQGNFLCLDAGKIQNGQPAVVWEKLGLKARFASPIVHDGRVYIANEQARLFCFDAKTGQQYWAFSYGKSGKGSPVLADGKIYVGEVDGRFHILQPGEKKCTRLHAEEFPPQGSDAEINGSPAIVNGRIYFQTNFETYCIGLKDHKAKADPIPAAPKETALGQNEKPDHIQVIPADVTLHPGEKVELKARAFSKGRLLGEQKVEWALAPYRWPTLAPKPPTGIPNLPPLKGELSNASGATTTLTVAAGPPQTAEVHAKLGDLTGYVRVRVVPKLPYAPNLDVIPVGVPMAGWVNCQGKFVTATLPDGSHVLRKTNVNPSPLVARAHAYMGLPPEHDYAVEADVQGTKVGTDLPDMGVSASRYILLLHGNSQQLRLQSWEALPRVDKAVAFAWQPNVWYKMKLTTEKVPDKNAVKILGKVWEASKPEPKDWTIEFTDPTPNTEGAPAIYANSTGILDKVPGAEIYFKNIKATPNAK